MDVRRQGQMGDNGMGEVPGISRSSALNNGMIGKVLGILLVLVSICALAWFANKALTGLSTENAVKDKQFQAVFLTNGQVYFGKVSNVDKSYVKITDIYYLQVQQTVQPKDNTAAANNQQVSLAKLGGELHGPEDVMYVSRQQVLFWENLKGDGKVAKAIADYKATGK
jgi:hypothetical protein